MKSIKHLFLLFIFIFSGWSSLYAACTPGGTSGDDDVKCTGIIDSFQHFYGGSDSVTLNDVTDDTYANAYWMDESLGGNPATDGDDTFIAHDSEFNWVLGFGGDDTFEVYGSTFRNLYGDTNPGHGVSQRGNDTILIEDSYSNGWILGGNDGDTITIRNSEVSFVAAGYSDIYEDTDYTPFDGNDSILLDNVDFTAVNYAYLTRPGAVEGGKGYDYITFINGGEAYNVTGGHGNDTISINGSVHFNGCTFENDIGNIVDCGIYGDEPYSSEPDETTIPVRHGNDAIFIYDADITDITINGGHGSDKVVLFSPVIITADTVIDGGDDWSAVDGFVDQLTFEQWRGVINGSNVNNWETIIFNSNTEISFADDTLVTGFESGINPVTDLPYGLVIQNGSSLKQVHDFEIDGNLHNKSVLDMQDGGLPGAVLSVTDNYASDDGRLYIDTVLNDGSATISDQLIIEGDTTGITTLFINNIGGTGSQTPDGESSGILVVQVNGESDGTFVLGRRLEAGRYSYDLAKGEDGNWYLRSEKKFFWPLFVPAFTNNQY